MESSSAINKAGATSDALIGCHVGNYKGAQTMDVVTFAVLSTFLKAASGLILTPDKAYLINSRLQPVMVHHGLKSVAELATKIRANPDERLKTDVVEAMTTNETSFFRDGTPFDNFRDYVIPSVIDRRSASKNFRILCAASSSGQEPYSLAMILADNAARLSGWKVEIVGIDLDTKILKRAEEGTYSQFEIQRGLPIQSLLKHFDQAPSQGWRVKPEVRKFVQFRRHNLLNPLTELGKFDVIFCRNVLIYFDAATKKGVLDRLNSQMNDDGFLFLGGSETVIDITENFAPLLGKRGLYIKRDLATRPRMMAS